MRGFAALNMPHWPKTWNLSTPFYICHVVISWPCLNVGDHQCTGSTQIPRKADACIGNSCTCRVFGWDVACHWISHGPTICSDTLLTQVRNGKTLSIVIGHNWRASSTVSSIELPEPASKTWCQRPCDPRHCPFRLESGVCLTSSNIATHSGIETHIATRNLSKHSTTASKTTLLNLIRCLVQFRVHGVEQQS